MRARKEVRIKLNPKNNPHATNSLFFTLKQKKNIFLIRWYESNFMVKAVCMIRFIRTASCVYIHIDPDFVSIYKQEISFYINLIFHHYHVAKA